MRDEYDFTDSRPNACAECLCKPVTMNKKAFDNISIRGRVAFADVFALPTKQLLINRRMASERRSRSGLKISAAWEARQRDSLKPPW